MSPVGTAELPALGENQPSLRDWTSGAIAGPRNKFLGYSQPSLREAFHTSHFTNPPHLRGQHADGGNLHARRFSLPELLRRMKPAPLIIETAPKWREMTESHRESPRETVTRREAQVLGSWSA